MVTDAIANDAARIVRRYCGNVRERLGHAAYRNDGPPDVGDGPEPSPARVGSRGDTNPGWTDATDVPPVRTFER